MDAAAGLIGGGGFGVNPARAGMIRVAQGERGHVECKPRASGDDP